jgi:hypothetical protein
MPLNDEIRTSAMIITSGSSLKRLFLFFEPAIDHKQMGRVSKPAPNKG